MAKEISKPYSPFESGLYIGGDIKDIKQLNVGKENFLILAKNDAHIELVKINSTL